MAPAPLLVVSPHLDDAALSCGRVLLKHPGAVVVTVFAGAPVLSSGVTAWDRAGGFAAHDDPIAVRREEDQRALSVLGAAPVWLDYVEYQYGEPRPSVSAISSALADTLAVSRAGTVLIPLGLEHPDHRWATAACLELIPKTPETGWLIYEEGLYRGARDHDRAFAALAARGLTVTPVRPPGDPEPERKRAALACYRSQLRACLHRGVPMLAEATIAERYWRLDLAGGRA